MAPDSGMIGNFSHWTSPPHTVLPIWESFSGQTSSYIKHYLTLAKHYITVAKHHLTVAKHNESSTLVSANFPSITITAPPRVMREQIWSVDNGSGGFILGFSKSHCFICVFFFCICVFAQTQSGEWRICLGTLTITFYLWIFVFLYFFVYLENLSHNRTFSSSCLKKQSLKSSLRWSLLVWCVTPLHKMKLHLFDFLPVAFCYNQNHPNLARSLKQEDLSPTKEALTRNFLCKLPFLRKRTKNHCTL